MSSIQTRNRAEANSKKEQRAAEARFKKEQRAQEGAKALAAYEVEGRAVRAKTARLRALRLAKEAAETPTELTQKTARKISKRVASVI